MTTYTAIVETETETKHFRTRSLSKARDIVDSTTDPAYVCHFVKYNKPMPIDYWNPEWREYVEKKGLHALVIGMTRW